jgi:hypothetical protein
MIEEQSGLHVHPTSVMTLTGYRAKECLRCHQTKSLQQFPPHASMQDGRDYWCWACVTSQRPVKLCKCCDQERPLAEFNRDAKRLDKLQYWCKLCQARYGQGWRSARTVPAALLGSTVQPAEDGIPLVLKDGACFSASIAAVKAAVSQVTPPSQPGQASVTPGAVKRCTKCGQDKPWDKFSKKAHKNGTLSELLRSECRQCRAAAQSAYRLRVAALQKPSPLPPPLPSDVLPAAEPAKTRVGAIARICSWFRELVTARWF